MASRSPYRILVLNQISEQGLQRLPAGTYVTGKDVADPDAILVRSADMHAMDIPASVKAIARAGAGTNNIPVKAMNARGVPVFNAPGANANAVNELVLSGMLMAARNRAPVLLNFSREGVVNDAAVIAALDAGQLAWYICDFPGSAIIGHPKVVALPHLGASTREAEENCAIMVADQLRDYLEHGNVANAVNF